MRARVIDCLRELARESVADRVNSRAAEVAFYAVFSLFPGLLIIAATLGSLDALLGHDIARISREVILGFLEEILTDNASLLMEDARELFTQESRGVLTLAIVVALWTLAGSFASVIEALDAAYVVSEKRPQWSILLTALALALGTVVVLAVVLVAVVFGSLFVSGDWLESHVGLSRIFTFAWDWLRTPIALVLLVLWLTTVYHLAPNRRSPWKRDLPGGFLAATLWIILSLGFHLYLRVASTGNQILGVLGGGLILLVWIYLLSVGLLLGGELNHVLRKSTRRVSAVQDRLDESQRS